jgi:hypothetical protein
MKGNAFSLSPGGLGEKVIILREEHALQFTSPIQQFWIVHGARTILMCCDHIYLTQAKTDSYGTRDVLIHVERDGH